MRIYKLSRELRDDIKPSPVYKGFYIHPEVTEVLINPNGFCICKKSCKFIKPAINSWGYYTFPRRTRLVNKLFHIGVAETFLKNKYSEEKNAVNHLDGDKLNPEVYNLEWCTPSINSIHAYETGLRPDNIRIDVKNLKTGEVFNFRSITEAAKFVGVNPGKISKYLKSGVNRKFVISNVFEVKREDQSWALTKHAIGKNISSFGYGVVVNRVGEEVYYLFNSTAHAAEFIGVNVGIVYSHLNKGTSNLDGTGFEAKKLYDCKIPINEMIDRRIERKPKNIPVRKPIPIKVSHPIWTHKKIYGSTQEFADEIGVSKNTVQCSVYRRNGKFRNYHIEYLVPTIRKDA